MRWTNLHKNLNQYSNCDSPKDVAEHIFGGNDEWRRFCNIKYVIEYKDRPDDPWNYIIDNDDWMTFWKPVYDLKSRPRSNWTDEEALSYFAMDLLIHEAKAGAGLRQ